MTYRECTECGRRFAVDETARRGRRRNGTETLCPACKARSQFDPLNLFLFYGLSRIH
jgi:NAD-dependent SIR2 family protein deacetylase